MLIVRTWNEQRAEFWYLEQVSGPYLLLYNGAGVFSRQLDSPSSTDPQTPELNDESIALS